MAINPLLGFSTASALSSPAIKNNNSTHALSFETMLGSLGGSEGGGAIKGHQAAAELLRIEMMLNSLSLSGDGEAPQTGGLRNLEAFLSVPAGYDHARRAPRVTDGPQAPPDEVPPEVSPDAVTDIGEIGSTAARYLGTPYRFGGEGAEGIDCSSFVQKVFREHQIDLPRTAREQSKVGSEVAQGDLRKGDLLFFHTYASYPSHVGIYLGEGKMIHASSGKGEVTVSDLNSDYYRSRFLGAKRVG